jgi:hypothetical protein
MDPVLAGTPFESLTALREIEGVARPTAILEKEPLVGSATAPTKKTIGGFHLIFSQTFGSKETARPSLGSKVFGDEQRINEIVEILVAIFFICLNIKCFRS